MKYNETYKSLIRNVLDNGNLQECRNGKNLIIPFASFTIDHDDWELKLRKMWYKGVKGEFDTLMDIENPLTNVSQFEANGCRYWSLWSSEDGSLDLDYYNRLHPQIEDVIENIKTDRYSRRHVVDLWSHDNVMSGKLSLACCWYNLTLSVIDDTIHLVWNQRSCDLAIGLPADVYLGHLFLEHVAKETGLKPGTMSFNLSNLHLYSEHIANASKLLLRSTADYNQHMSFELKE